MQEESEGRKKENTNKEREERKRRCEKRQEYEKKKSLYAGTVRKESESEIRSVSKVYSNGRSPSIYKQKLDRKQKKVSKQDTTPT